MKKWLWVALLMVLMMVALPAYALEADSGALGVDWGQVVVWMIGTAGTILSALLARMWMKHVKPWLQERGLYDAAMTVIRAVEAQYGGIYNGMDKWLQALDKMVERGYDTASPIVQDAMNIAWFEMNMEQVAVGIKPATVFKPPLEPDKTAGEEGAWSPWMCGCGYEGNRSVDGGVCPNCCGGAGNCEGNG